MTNVYPLNESTRTTWPGEHDWNAKRAEYIRRGEVLKGADYTTDEHTRLGLFRLMDGNSVIHETRRVSTRLAFMVAVDAASIANGCALNVRPDAYPATKDAEGRQIPDPRTAEALKAGNEVWRRSGVSRNLHRWATQLATKGDLHLESTVRVVGGAKRGVIFAHKAEHIKCLRYDGMGIELEYAEIEFTAPIAGYGDGKPVVYNRKIERDKITTTIDGKVDADMSGPNRSGVVTLTHIPHTPSDDITFSACAFTGYEDGVAIENSSDMIVQVLAHRNAAPILVLMGGITMPATNVDGTDAATTKGATPYYELPQGGDAKLMEAALSGLSAIVENATRVATEAKANAPQFLFTDAGASSSGLALSNRATQFTAYIEPRREWVYQGLSRALSIALCLERNQPFDESADVYEVKGGAALPLDKAAFVQLVKDLLDAGLITRVDAVTALQGLGVGLPEETDPIEYADRALADKHAVDNAESIGVERASAAYVAARKAASEPAPLPDANIETVDGADAPAA